MFYPAYIYSDFDGSASDFSLTFQDEAARRVLPG